jgi:quinol-cytochrome oxidoreductase complex cytochrome b subunit/mono/diheme cytochrome c family protein
VIRVLTDWLNHRTGYRKFLGLMLIEHIPGGARWRYVWGSCLAFVFAIQLITGILLMTAYSPSDTSAWGSVYFIQYQMDFGWLIRGLHHFGSQTMVVLLALHMLQVVIAGAHLPPREVNWWLGIMLMGVVFGLSLTGYLLPWDQKGYYATQVATNIAKDIPYIGEALREFLIGGSEYGTATLTRFFTLHVGVLPFTMIVLVILHLVAFRRHGVTTPRFRPEDVLRFPIVAFVRDVILGALLFAVCWFFHLPWLTCALVGGLFWMFAASRFITKPVAAGWFWPNQAFRDLLVCLFIFGVMTSLVVFGGHGNPIPPAAGAPEPSFYDHWAKAGQRGLGANLDAPADPETSSYPARPEWYFLFLFQLLKYFPGDLKLIGTVVVPNGAFVVLVLLPLLGYGRMRKFGHFVGVLVVVLLLGGAGALTLLAIADDSLEPFPFGKAEPFTLTKKDEKERKAFHQHVEHAEIEAKRAVAMAADGIPMEGGREMVRRDPLTRGPLRFQMYCAGCHSYTPADKDAVHFNDPKAKYTAADLGDYATESWIRGLLENPGDNKYFGRTNLGRMKSWRKGIDREREKLKKVDPDAVKKIADEEREFNLIAKFLAQQAKKPNDRDEKVEKMGLEAFKTQCADCHRVGQVGGDAGEPGPVLTDYGSQEWIRMMIAAPHHELRYGGRNRMPAFRDFEGPGGELRKLEFDELNNKKMDGDNKVPAPQVIQMSDVDRELIVRWLTRDYRAVFGGSEISGPLRK